MGMLADRLRKNERHLRKWARRQGYGCLRLYNFDIPEFPFSLDDYEGRLLLTLPQKAAPKMSLEAVLEEIHLALPDSADPVIKSKGESGQLDASRSFLVAERELNFEVNLHGHQDSGLFLDHRLTRQRVQQLASGLRVLNLFCYTASFSVAAALGGARRVTSVDLSRTYLEWGQRNFQHNRLDPQAYDWVQADVLTWLQRPGEYDLILCDPPTFSNSKRMRGVFDVQRDHVALVERLLQLLAPDGQLFFSCNDSRFRLDSSLPLRDITNQTQSPDFQRRGGHRCFLGRRPAL